MDSKQDIVHLEKASLESPTGEEPPHSGYEIDPEAERRLIRKLDWMLLPIFIAIYTLNYIDRTAIGNALVAGLQKDLGLKGVELNIALTTFYISYTLADIPSNLLLKRFGSVWIAYLVIGFGVVSLGSAFMKNYAGLIAARFFLGAAEGGTLSGLVYILSRYYRRRELVLRVGVFFGISPSISGAFGGLIASGLLRLNDIGSVTRWRKIFLIEGIVTTTFGIICLFIIPGDPSTTRMLNQEERKLALARIDADQVVKNQGRKEKTTLRGVLRSFNFITIVCTISYVMLSMSFTGISLFLPSVINSLGKYTTVEVQLRSVPPFLASAAWVIASAYVSFRIKKRFVPIIASVLLVMAGYAIAISTKNPQARYAACFFLIMGGSVGGPMLVTWGTDNAAPDTMRAVVSAAIVGIGAIGAIVGVWTYVPSDAPDYRIGNTANLVTTAIICVLTAITAAYIRWENAKRDRGERDYRLKGTETTEELEQMGYRHPQFRYQI